MTNNQPFVPTVSGPYVLTGIDSIGCKDIKILSLLFKKVKYKYNHNIDWFGFNIDDLFVIGYGMDYEYKFRGLSSIYYMLDN